MTADDLEDFQRNLDAAHAREAVANERSRKRRRAELLASVAGSVAAGLEANPVCDTWETEETARHAVEVAREILRLTVDADDPTTEGDQ